MKKKSLLLLLLALVLALSTSVAVVVTAAGDDDKGVVYVHFYNATGEYHYDEWGGKQDINWGAYYWIENGKVVRESGDDQDFSREVDGKMNVGKVFKITLNASETKAVKQGRKLGLIMVRCYVDNIGYFTPYWNNNEGKDMSADRMLSVNLDANNEYHVWIIAGDKNNYESLEEAKSAFERVESANFEDFDTLLLQTTKAITTSTNVTIYKVTDAEENPDGVVLAENLHVSETWDNGKGSKITGLSQKIWGDGNKNFEWGADYQVYIKDVSPFRASAVKTRLFLSDKFKTDCVPADNTELGAIYEKTKTTFRFWAPLSTNVTVNFYRTGNELDDTLYASAQAMTRKDKGLWEYVAQGNLDGVYYTYTNYVYGDAVETVDTYANAVGVNGNRAMVCDMTTTDPEGWTNDVTTATEIRDGKYGPTVIWEIHVRDFSIAPDSGLTYKGKYLAFTEENTHVKGSTLESGIAYLKKLGVTYVQLNPVYDFATVDEEFINNTDYTTKQNWGYDPKNYNVPEGSYATNAEDGKVRIKEFKQMVAALHKAGIGVIMDVVYNHTYSANSYFEKEVPGYYYRQALLGETGSFGFLNWARDGLGNYKLSDGSGCGTETASERAMFRKYMIDSLTYWAKEYHIDGFRFDLMAIHDVTTMNAIRASLDTLPGGNGILMYGEPWAAGSLGLDPAMNEISASSDNLNALNERIAAFNDRMRGAIKGDNNPGTGYVQGNFNNIEQLKTGVKGYFYGVDAASSHTITYTTSHDNYTLWDQLVATTVSEKTPTMYTERNSVIEKKNMMAAALTLTSRGRSFLLAGEEIARTKYGNHNSYNAQDKVNAFDYSRQEQFSRLFNWYQGLIQLRKNFPSMQYGTSNVDVWTFGEESCMGYIFTKESDYDKYQKVMVMYNPYGTTRTLTVEGEWKVLANSDSIDFNSTNTVSGTITLPSYGTAILVQ